MIQEGVNAAERSLAGLAVFVAVQTGAGFIEALVGHGVVTGQHPKMIHIQKDYRTANAIVTGLALWMDGAAGVSLAEVGSASKATILSDCSLAA